jgi:hypothetical protein
MFRSYDHHQAENILLSRTTQLTTDPLFYKISNITVIVYLLLRLVYMLRVAILCMLRIDDMLLLWAMLFLRCVPSRYRYPRRSACQYRCGCNLCINSSMLAIF